MSKKFIILSKIEAEQSESPDFIKQEVQTSDFEKSEIKEAEQSESPDFIKQEVKTSDFEKSEILKIETAELLTSENVAFSTEKQQTYKFNKPEIFRKENSDFSKEEVQTSKNEKSRLHKIGSQDFKKQEVKTSKNEKPRLHKTGSADFTKSECNYIYKKNTYRSDNNISQSSQSENHEKDRQDVTDDIAQKIETYTDLIKQNICYNDLLISKRFDAKLIDEFISIMIDVILTPGQYVRISGEDKPRGLVKSNFLKLNYSDMEHAIDKFKGVTDRIIKKKQYITSLLYNCKMELDSHYCNLVKYDMYNRE